MNGIINIYKELGYTSHDVVAKARGILKVKRIGHTGTLDPQAEGVLPICVGVATKAADLLTNKDKRYVATVALGATTTTEDATGEILEEKPVDVTKEQIQKAVDSFVGSYMQTPPMYSALKVNGKKLYELAREGIVIDRKSREIMIYECNIIEYISPSEFVIDVKCSKGTYIRTLCKDIGEALGTGAHMKTLIRTQVGNFNVANSIKLSELEKLRDDDQIESCLIQTDQLFLELPKLQVKPSGNKYLYNGNQLQEDLIIEEVHIKLHNRVRIYDFENVFIGIYKIKQIESNIYFTPEKIFLSRGI
ncbi:MAG TPA: tRNA pseudouridine(55) synthase TruB [Epulopiscium sp.]|nr:tRNA pseudouridine(55) synthase TruB [Candidatus Epulonipiscium sp.]